MALPQENLEVSLASGGSGLPNEDAQVAGENGDQSLPTGNKADDPGYPSRFGLALLAVGLCFAVFLVALVRRYGRYC